MNEKIALLKEAFTTKEQQLEHARQVLKTEFFGIDKAIDELITNVRSWYILNDYQTRPLVINLWGLTGVGKTSLITRLMELLNYQDHLFRFDLGVKTGRYSFSNGIEDLCERNEDEPTVIILDEFQHSRTLTSNSLLLGRSEIEDDKNRKIWDLIDSGNIEYYSWSRGLSSLMETTQKLYYLTKCSITVKNGCVVKGKEIYLAEFGETPDLWYTNENSTKTREKLYFIDPDDYTKIMDLAGEELGFNLVQDLKKHLLTLNGSESLDFLHKVIKIARKPKTKEFKKALIFIIGNLDEAYQMSNNLSADVDADIFYKASLKITVPKIKQALSTRFRKEQISRLGNIHIIYPSLNKAAFNAIILNEFKNIASKTESLLGLKLKFDESVATLIYKEGVFPTQGVRPLITSINYIIKTNLSLFFTEVIINNLETETLQLSFTNRQLECSYINSNLQIQHKKSVNILTPLEDNRASRKDDMQAITAVHESGHAILSAILLKVIPSEVHSITTDTDSDGFVYTKFPWSYISKKEIINRVAMFLGGIAAEELIFGKDNITAGSSQDILLATEFLSEMYKTHGMNNTFVYFNTNSEDNHSYHICHDIEEAIKDTIDKGYELAKTTLKQEMNLLLIMANYLSDFSSINHLELKSMITEHKTTPVEFIENGKHLFYRNHLKKQTQSSGLETISKDLFSTISLNHKKNTSLE